MNEAVHSRSVYITQRRLEAAIQCSDTIIRRFPSRHSCEHCREKIIDALRPKDYLPVYIGDVDSAIKAASNGCPFFEWLLDFWIRSYGSDWHPAAAWPPVLKARDGVYLEGKFLSRDWTNIYSVDFLVGTNNYRWPCVSFDVFTEQGQCSQMTSSIQLNKN
jgi:hypothetical protein